MKKTSRLLSAAIMTSLISCLPVVGSANNYNFDDYNGAGGPGGSITGELERELNTWPNIVKCRSTYQSSSNHDLYTMNTFVFVLSQARISIDKRSGVTNESIVIYQQAGPLSTTATVIFNAGSRTILFDAVGSNLPSNHNCTQGTHINELNAADF